MFACIYSLPLKEYYPITVAQITDVFVEFFRCDVPYILELKAGLIPTTELVIHQYKNVEYHNCWLFVESLHRETIIKMLSYF